MVFSINNLCGACSAGDIQTVRDIVNSKEVNINETVYGGSTPLMCAMRYIHTEVVRLLLTQPELQLDKRDSDGETALHMACLDNWNIPVFRMLRQDRRCTPSVVNIKNNDGWTALMLAVYYGRLEIVKEMEKVEGIDFDTKDNNGRTLIEVARVENETAVLEYLRDRKKNTLEGMAANSVAKHLKNKEDVDALVDDQHIPQSLKPLVVDFIDNDDDDDDSDDD